MPTPSSPENSLSVNAFGGDPITSDAITSDGITSNVIPLFGSSHQDIADISRFVRSLDRSNHQSDPSDGDPLLDEPFLSDPLLNDDAQSFNAAMQKLTLVLEQAPEDSRQRHETLPRVVEWLGLEGFDQQQAA